MEPALIEQSSTRTWMFALGTFQRRLFLYHKYSWRYRLQKAKLPNTSPLIEGYFQSKRARKCNVGGLKVVPREGLRNASWKSITHHASSWYVSEAIGRHLEFNFKFVSKYWMAICYASPNDLFWNVKWLKKTAKHFWSFLFESRSFTCHDNLGQPFGGHCNSHRTLTGGHDTQGWTTDGRKVFPPVVHWWPSQNVSLQQQTGKRFRITEKPLKRCLKSLKKLLVRDTKLPKKTLVSKITK